MFTRRLSNNQEIIDMLKAISNRLDGIDDRLNKSEGQATDLYQILFKTLIDHIADCQKNMLSLRSQVSEKSNANKDKTKDSKGNALINSAVCLYDYNSGKLGPAFQETSRGMSLHEFLSEELSNVYSIILKEEDSREDSRRDISASNKQFEKFMIELINNGFATSTRRIKTVVPGHNLSVDKYYGFFYNARVKEYEFENYCFALSNIERIIKIDDLTIMSPEGMKQKTGFGDLSCEAF